MLRALGRARLRSAPGTRVRYSNFAVGVLGHALTAAGLPYSELLTDRVLAPLALRDTDCAPAAPRGGTQVTGYGRRRSQPPLRTPGLPAAGALRSSAHDLLTVTERLLDPASAETPAALRAALHEVLPPRLRLPRGSGLSLIWNIRPRGDGSRLHHHSGGTFGCTAFAGFNPHHGTALVARRTPHPATEAAPPSSRPPTRRCSPCTNQPCLDAPHKTTGPGLLWSSSRSTASGAVVWRCLGREQTLTAALDNPGGDAIYRARGPRRSGGTSAAPRRRAGGAAPRLHAVRAHVHRRPLRGDHRAPDRRTSRGQVPRAGDGPRGTGPGRGRPRPGRRHHRHRARDGRRSPVGGWRAGSPRRRRHP
ncbi:MULTISPECIES: serine hydrolase domain-containing protein [unclassified Streptomyces]|uniref:serine hydrolase domain-containing protein n=1 Tax=unclassified Streptomyces TaxID=2593676 RepID=UPI00214CBD9B|nr:MULTISPECIES: serine hydrolase domain-containing protein [unclassified Streptomyces]